MIGVTGHPAGWLAGFIDSVIGVLILVHMAPCRDITGVPRQPDVPPAARRYPGDRCPLLRPPASTRAGKHSA